jgi:hypothetical protein
LGGKFTADAEGLACVILTAFKNNSPNKRGNVMNYKKMVVAALLVGTFSAGAMAAKEITREDAQKNNYTSLGTVSIDNEQTAPMDAKKAISKLADEKGGKYFVVISADTDNKISATAEVFK